MIRVWKLLKKTTMLIILIILTICIHKVESNSTSADEAHCSKTITKNCEILKENEDEDCCEYGFCCKNAGKNNSYICDDEQVCCPESLLCFRPTSEKKGPTLGELSWVFSVVPLVIVLIFYITRAYMIRRWKRRQLQVQNNQPPETPLQENNWQTNYSPQY